MISYFEISFNIIYENWGNAQVLSLSLLGYSDNLMAKECSFGN